MRWLALAFLVTPAAADVTAVRGLLRGDIVSAADLEGDASEIALLIGQSVRRPIAAGRKVRLYDVEEPADVVRQQGVSIRFVRGPLVLRTEGRAMQTAQIGDRITVALNGRRQPLSAVVVAPGVVEVRP